MLKPFMVLFISIGLLSFSPTKSIDSHSELVLRFEGLSDKDVIQTENIIKRIEGLQFIDYCEKHKVFMLSYDNRVYPNADLAIKAISNTAPELRPVQMLGNSIESISNDCNH